MPKDTIAKSRASKKRAKNKKNRKPEVPDCFNEPADATKYLIMEERCFVTRRHGKESHIEALIEDVTQEEFVEIMRVLGGMRGYLTA